MQQRNGIKLEWSQFGRNYVFRAIISLPDRMLFCDTAGESKWAVVREGCSQKWERYGPSVCPWAKHSASSITGKPGSSLSTYLCFHLRGKCSVAVSLWRDTDHKSKSSQLEKDCAFSPPPRLPLHPVEDSQGWGILSVFCSEKWKFESGRWSKASKGTCNWAALDRLSGNMKQQQLWRRVIASLGPYNALSSL